MNLNLFLFLCVCVLESYADSSQLSIPLYRQKTPRENILETPNIPHHGIWLDWLKKPKPKPFRNNDTISLMRFLDVEFYGYINVGNPGQKMKVIFDTAWSTSWVMSADCPTKTIGCWFHSKFDHKTSSTYKENNKPYIADEGTYNLTGYYSLDEINFGHSTVNQTFVEIVDVPYWYVFSKADGVIGLAMDRGETTPFFYNILRQTNITNPVFSVYLNRDKSSTKGGSISIGFIDKTHIHCANSTNIAPANYLKRKCENFDNITYVPLNADSTMWEFTMDNVFVNDSAKNKSYPICTENCVTFTDTSTNSITTTKKYLTLINQKINAKPLFFGRYEVNCDTINKLPTVIFNIGGTSFKLRGKDYVQKVSLRLVTLCISAFVEGTDTSQQNRWLLGGAFLSKFFSIYDLGKKQIGFVRAASA